MRVDEENGMQGWKGDKERVHDAVETIYTNDPNLNQAHGKDS